jgi:Acyl-CoA dehydrogenase, middle domain
MNWAPECFRKPGDLKLAALAVTEPSGGSDIRSIETRARRDGSDWVIDGHKATERETPCKRANGEGRNRTGDTTIFSRVLYQLSYLAAAGRW